jgi:predicted DNA-binding transcriptional regulator
VTSAILTLLIEGVEEDAISAYFKLEWYKGPIAYILVRDGEIVQRVFIENDVIIGDEAGKIMIEYLELAPCDLSVYQIPTFELDGLEKNMYQETDEGNSEEIDEEVDETLEEYEQSFQNRNFSPDKKAEPRNFKRDYSDRYSEENPHTAKNKGEDTKNKKDNEDKQESVSRYAFPLFNKKSSDKIIKTFSSSPSVEKQEEPQEKSSLPSFKDHVLSTYFSMSESHEMKGEREKACSVLEEALEVPQIDKLAVYRYLLSMYKRYNMIDNELDVLRRMAVDFKSDQTLLSWVNRQIAVTYIRKGNRPADTVELPTPSPQTSQENPPKGGFFSKIFGKDKK